MNHDKELQGQKIGVGLRRGRILREKTAGKREVHSFFEYLGANSAGIICLIVPIMMAVSTGKNVTVGDSDFVTNTAVWKLIGYEVLLIWGGLKICELVNAVQHVNTAIGAVIGWFASLFTRVFCGLLILVISVGALIGSNVTSLLYGGWQYKLANDFDTGAEQAILNEIDRYQDGLKSAIDRNCLTVGICPRSPAEMWRGKITDAEQRLVELRSQVSAVETGGYEMISAALAKFWPDVSVEKLVGWVNSLTAVLFSLGTLMAPYVVSNTYYRPVAEFFADRKARKDYRDGISDAPEERLLLDQPSISGVLLKKASMLRGAFAHKLDSGISIDTPKPKLPVAAFAPAAVESAHPPGEIRDWGVPEIAHPAEGHTPVQGFAPPGADYPQGVQNIVQNDNAPPVTVNAHPVQTPHDGGSRLERGFADGVQNDTNLAFAHPIAQPHTPETHPQKRAEIVPISADVVPSDSEVDARDRRVCDEIKKRHPDYPALSDTELMRHIRSIGGELNRAAGEGNRIGGRKAERIFYRMTGKTWVSPRPKTPKKRATRKRS